MQMSIKLVGGAYWSWGWQLGEGLRWRTADEALTYANVNYQQEAPIGAGDGSCGRECVGALRLMYRHVEVSIMSVGAPFGAGDGSWRRDCVGALQMEH